MTTLKSKKRYLQTRPTEKCMADLEKHGYVNLHDAVSNGNMADKIIVDTKLRTYWLADRDNVNMVKKIVETRDKEHIYLVDSGNIKENL